MKINSFIFGIHDLFFCFRLAERLSEQIWDMRYRLINGSDEVKDKLDDIIRRLLDLQDQTQKSKDKSNEADNINYNVFNELKNLQVKCQHIYIEAYSTHFF